MKITFQKKPNLRLMSIVPEKVIRKKPSYTLTPEWLDYLRNMVKQKLVTVTFEWKDEEAKKVD